MKYILEQYDPVLLIDHYGALDDVICDMGRDSFGIISELWDVVEDSERKTCSDIVIHNSVEDITVDTDRPLPSDWVPAYKVDYQSSMGGVGSIWVSEEEVALYVASIDPKKQLEILM
jgi:hypothetical protein